MFNWFDSRKKTLPVQVLENRNDIDELKQYIAYTYGYNGELTTDTTSCPQGNTDVPNNTTYGFLIDNVGHVFKILGVTSSIVTIKYYATITGAKGETGQGYNEMGEWTSSNKYHLYDVVSYNGSSYVCIAEVHNSDIPPSQDTTHWTIFASGADAVDLIYEMNTKNTIGGKPYTAGIPFSSITISNVDFTSCKSLRFTCRWNHHGDNWFGGTITFDLDLTTPYNSDANYMAVISSRPSNCYIDDSTTTFDLIGQIVVNGSKNLFSVNGYKLTYTGQRTAYTSDNYLQYFRIEKIEGIK